MALWFCMFSSYSFFLVKHWVFLASNTSRKVGYLKEFEKRKSRLLTWLWISAFLSLLREASQRNYVLLNVTQSENMFGLSHSTIWFSLQWRFQPSQCTRTLVFLIVTFCAMWNVSNWSIENMGWEAQWGRLLWRWAWEICPDSFVPRCTETAVVVHRGQLCCISIAMIDDDGPLYLRDTWEVLVSHVVSVKRQVICLRLCPEGCLWEDKHLKGCIQAGKTADYVAPPPRSIYVSKIPHPDAGIF